MYTTSDWLNHMATVQFSQPAVLFHSNLQNLGEKNKEYSWEWLLNTDPGVTVV